MPCAATTHTTYLLLLLEEQEGKRKYTMWSTWSIVSHINLVTRNSFHVCSGLNFFFNLNVFDARPREIHYYLQTEVRGPEFNDFL